MSLPKPSPRAVSSASLTSVSARLKLRSMPPVCSVVIAPASKTRYLEIVGAARGQGADSVIFGCTEVGLLIGPGDFDIPTFDTTRIHAEAALDFALAKA